MDSSVDPCDDFYTFACGGFVKTATVPPDQSTVSTYTVMREALQENLKALLAEKITRNDIRPFALLKQLYKTCINKKAIESRGLKTINMVLEDSIGGWPVLKGDNWSESNFDWTESIYKLRKWGYSANYISNVYVGINPKNSSQRVIMVSKYERNFNQH